MHENPHRSPDDEIGQLAASKKSWIAFVLKLLGVLAVILLLIGLMLPAVRTARPAAYRNACLNNLKQITIGVRAYQEKYGALPPAYTTDADGRPLHSWRTLILPFIEESKLYKSIDLTKPWDDPVNVDAFKRGTDVYRCPSALDRDDNMTTYLAIVGPNSCFQSTMPRKASDITDGLSKTLMIIEVDPDHAVPWMAPIDADETLVMGIGSKSKLAHGAMNGAFADGSVRSFDTELPADQRRALISIAGDDNAVIKLDD